MAVQKRVVKSLLAALVMSVALLTVGLTAAAESPFTISIHTAFLQLGIDIDVKIGPYHLHASWSALSSTKPAADRF